MSTREKRKPLFDENALADDLDELWPAAQPSTPAPAVPAPTPIRAAAPASRPVPPPAPAPAPPPTQANQSPVGQTISTSPSRRLTATAASTPSSKRIRPPEVLLSAEVYDELYRVQIAEKKIRRGLARPMGAIVLDAIEAHAPRLATTWSDQRYAVGEGQLFERPSSTAVPRRRRHANPPRTVVLSGVTAANGQRLDDLVQAWDAGTRSALVEQALRYQFDLLPGT
jgi:hypothetical protein